MDSVLNSPVLTSALWIGLLLFFVYLGRKGGQGWKAWEGTIIQAVKLAEQTVPDGSSNKSLARFDTALKGVIAAYEQAKGIAPDAATIEQFKQAISIVHARLERDGNL